ncbi:serine hydrolase domain-containing protein [Marinicella meishanensis]|uniref:serine hydrolase domain-containing protein n=1 Tax=Marinicella meishanensis TaxID=2873263 RepID=UPI001CC12D37|nr:serine hydrolase domain-containing protein [Marinicella sp. NBU2979]
MFEFLRFTKLCGLCCWLWPLSGAAKPNLLADIDRLRQQHDIAAAAVVWVTADQVLLDHYLGVADHRSQQALGPQSRYRIGSISKSFAGLLALRLQATGQLDLHAPVADYGLSPYITNGHADSPISLAHLLEHSAGLGDLLKAEWDHNTPGDGPLQPRFELGLGDHRSHWAPGLHASYSNVGYGLFGLALELTAKQTYEALMQQQVFKPLQMTHSDVLLTQEIKQHLITGYDRDGVTPIPFWHNIYRPFAAINTNNQDMIRWLQALLREDPAWLSAKQWQRWRQPTTTLAARNGLTFGYGLGVYQWQVQGHDFWGHGGDADGYLTRFGLHPASGQAYFIMINAFNHRALNAMVDRLEAQLIAGLQPPPKPLLYPVDGATLAAYVGCYRSVTSRFTGRRPQTLVIRRSGQGLTAQLSGGPSRELLPVSTQHFRRPHETTATMGFYRHQGQLYYQGHEGNFVRLAATPEE